MAPLSSSCYCPYGLPRVAAVTHSRVRQGFNMPFRGVFRALWIAIRAFVVCGLPADDSLSRRDSSEPGRLTLVLIRRRSRLGARVQLAGLEFADLPIHARGIVNCAICGVRDVSDH
jgi:hypothetical protein